MLWLVYVVLGAEPRALNTLGKHSTNGTTFPALGFWLFLGCLSVCFCFKAGFHFVVKVDLQLSRYGLKLTTLSSCEEYKCVPSHPTLVLLFERKKKDEERDNERAQPYTNTDNFYCC